MINETGNGGGMSIGGALDLACLDSMPSQLAALAQGTVTSDEQAAAPFNCVDRALETFSTLTRGENSEYYHSEELRLFLNRYFLNGRQVSRGLMNAAMETKAAILGGNGDRISRQDLSHLRDFMRTLKTEAIRLRAVLPLFMGGRNLSPEQSAAVTPLLVQSADNLGRDLEISTGRYTFAQLDNLFAQLNQFIHSNSAEAAETSALAMAGKCVPLMAGAKALIFGTEGSEIRANEWRTLLRVGAHLAVAYITYANGPRQLDWISEPGVRVVAGMARSFAQAVREIPTATGVLSHHDQGNFRDAVAQSLDGAENYRNLSKFIGLGLLGARVLFADSEGNILLSRISALPESLNQMAPHVGPVTQWLQSALSDPLPSGAFEDAAGPLGQYMAQRVPLTRDFIESSLRFLGPLLPDADEYQSYLEMAFAIKKLITGHLQDQVAGSDWSALLETAADGSATAWLFRSQVMRSPYSWQSEEFQMGLRAAVSAAVYTLRDVVNRHANSVLTFNTLDDTLQAFGRLAAQKEIELPISIPVISGVLRPVFTRIFAGRNPAIRRANGITVPALLVAKDEFLRWSITQGLIETAFRQIVPAESLAGSVLPVVRLREVAERMRARLAERDPGAELLDLLESYPRLLRPGETKLFFPAVQRGMNDRNFEELIMLNVVRSAVKLVGEGYTSEPNRPNSTLTISKEQMQAAFEGVYPLLLELNQMDAEDVPEKLASDLTKYGNLFPSTANGGTVIEEGEAAEMLLHVLSARALRTELFDALVTAGCRPQGGTPAVPDLLPARCVREKLFGPNNGTFVRVFMPIMPRMIDEMLQMEPQERQRLFRSLEKGGREGAEADAPFTRSQLKRMIHLLQFAESMVQRFDEDWTNILEFNEAMGGAYAVFEHELTVASPLGGISRDIFGHIMRYGEPPRSLDNCRGLQCLARALGSFGWIINWRTASGSTRASMNLTRLKLLTLFASLGT